MQHRILKTLTLGCKVNQYETEYVRQGLARVGYRAARSGEPADLCVVNTCTVTADGEAKSRKAIRHLARENPGAEIIVMGCYAARLPDEAAALPGVVEVIADKRELPDLLARRGVIDVPSGIATFGRRHRAYVKVQNGCRMACSYCIIPLVRPHLESRPVEHVLDEVRRLVDHGHREIVLTGIHLGHYGIKPRPAVAGNQESGDRGQESGVRSQGSGDRNVVAAGGSPRGVAVSTCPSDPGAAEAHATLAGLVRRLADLPGEFRVRISSIEASEATPELLAVMADRPDRVCPHLHLSMQSGSDAVLQRMRRRQTAAEFLAQCERARRALDHPALTTDVIVGFPGETDEDFAATCRAVESAGFSKLHVFRYSPRQGTPAADLPDQIPETVKRRRATELSALGDRLRQQYFQTLLGRSLQVLVETRVATHPGHLRGTAARYVPVELPGDERDVGRLVTATVEGVQDGHLQAAAQRACCTLH